MKTNPSTIYVASPETKINYEWEQDYNKLSKKLELKTIEELENLPTIERNKFDVENIEEGMVFLYDKIDNRYIRVSENIQQKFEESKNRAIDHIASLLGARKISRSVESTECRNRTIQADGSIGYKISDASLNTNFSSDIKNSQKYNRIKEYPGQYNTDGYRKALDYCKSTGLINDPGIFDMLRARDPQHPNPILRDSYTVCITSECEDSMEAAFSLNILAGVFKLSADIKEIISQKKSISLSLDIEYSPIQ